MGGDEFALVLPGLPAGVTQDTTDRFVRSAEGAARAVAAAVPVSLSLGVARLGVDGDSAQALLEAADRRMYDTKTKRKQVQRADSLYSGQPSTKSAVNE
jgi:diguanylate cyclase (GGDEF)-like protein